MVKNSAGREIDFEVATNLMDDELREELYMELAPCTEQEFYDEYCNRHKEKFGEVFHVD